MIHHENHALRTYTTFDVGGIAEDFFIPESESELLELISRLRASNKPYVILGNGSNLLILSKKVRKAVILAERALNHLEVGESGQVAAGASVDIRKLINACTSQGLRAPVELLTIPATVGGAIYWNAGRTTLRTTISDSLESVRVFDGSREFSLTKEQCRFGHRDSVFQEDASLVILGAVFQYEFLPKAQILAARRESLEAGADKCYRTEKSAGSVFKICNMNLMKILRGLRIGDAQFAPKTANCIINKGNAKPFQIYFLIRVAQLLHRLTGKKCELEIEIW